jgi:hypothetical protein
MINATVENFLITLSLPSEYLDYIRENNIEVSPLLVVTNLATQTAFSEPTQNKQHSLSSRISSLFKSLVPLSLAQRLGLSKSHQ